jgi:DNA-binding MarR family transcriptional regulator
LALPPKSLLVREANVADDPTYVRLFNLLNAIRDLAPFSVLTAEEDELLRSLLVRWHRETDISISDVTETMSGVSPATAYRRIIKLRDKGLVQLRVDQHDKRVKFVEPTEAALQYARHVHSALEALVPSKSA